jgi:hypothetical protein
MKFNFKLCSPALLYLVFSVTQVVIDAIKGLYNVALLKFVMMILFTLLLNILCERGLGIVSWIIVFIPFILMSLITTILLFVFGLDPSSGNIIPPKSSQLQSTPTVSVKDVHTDTNTDTHTHSKSKTSTTTQHHKKEDDDIKHHSLSHPENRNANKIENLYIHEQITK